MSVEEDQDIFTLARAEEGLLCRCHFVDIHRELCLIEENAQWADQVLAQLQLYKRELSFLIRFSHWAASCGTLQYANSLAEKKLCLIWEKEKMRILTQRLSLIRRGFTFFWQMVAEKLKKKLEKSKLVIEEWCKHWLSPDHIPISNENLIILLDAILTNLRDLLSYKAGETVPPNDQFEILERKLVCLRNILKVTAGCIYNEDFIEKIKTCTSIFVQNAVCLTFLCCVKATGEDNANKMDLMVSDILLRIEPCMLDIMVSYFPPLKYGGSIRGNIVRYLDAVLSNLKDLIVRYKAGEIVPLTMQMETLEQKLMFLRNFSNLAANCVKSGDFIKFMNYVHDFSKSAASLTVLYWLRDEQTTSEMIRTLSIMVQKIEPCTRDVTNVYFGTLKAMRLQQSDTHLLGQTVVTMADLLLENLVTVKDFQILRDELIFVLAFLADPSIQIANNDELTLVLQKIDVLLWERWHLISAVDTEDFIEIEVHNFRREIEIVNARIRRLYDEYPYSSIPDFPGIIGQGFLDFLIRNLKNSKEKLISDTKFLPFVKYIWKIEEELVSLRPLFSDSLELQKDEREPSDTRLQLINLAYLTEHVVDSCFVFDYPVSYHMACLHDLLNKIKDVKTKFEKIKEFSVYNVGDLPYSGTSTSILSKQALPSYINQIVVGFEEHANIIIDKLTCGHKSLDIVSIVGMAGIGKTTLARKVYVAPSVKRHFHIFAFCSVSRDYNAKRLLLDILCNITVIDDASTKDDLAHQLRKCLSGKRYLIVMDDMWEVRAWNDVKSSFPDNQNGSRVMLTTRFHKVAKEAQMKYCPYHLGFLPDEKSWELLQNKVFSNRSCPPNLYDIGKQIAKNCKGLPLAVVLIAGLLKRTKHNLSWWSEIAERVVSYVSEEGCKKMLEFSYKYLPEYLKPLLLYFGAFPEDTLISRKSLILLWINEGFVQESNTKSLEDVAKDYLHDLVDSSLVIVAGRSSNGGIKTIGVHDLIHDFCRTKAQAENFFRLKSSSDHPINNPYRVCIQMAGETLDKFTPTFLGNITVDVTPTFCVRSLLSFQRCNDAFGNDLEQMCDWKFKLLQVLHLENMWLGRNDLEQMCELVDLRHIVAPVNHLRSVPSSISNLWALENFILRTMGKNEILLPETIWEMKWLRHVNISRCKLIFPGGHELEVYSKLENVESFATPTLSTGKDLEKLLQRLPAVRKLSCRFKKSCDYLDKQMKTLDFLNQIESLNLDYVGDENPYEINFPSTLKKLKLSSFKLPWTAISHIGKLQHLEVLELLWNSFTGPVWEMEEDVVFPSLKFMKLNGLNLVRWNAVPESFPCLEQLSVIGCDDLVEIPPCFGVISTLKRFKVHLCRKATSSAAEIVNDQMDWGNDTLDADIWGGYEYI